MTVALLPIHPKYADAILSGDKQVEFRRRNFKKDVTHVVIYASSPIMRVVGFFEIDSVDVSQPHTAWNKYGQVGSIKKVDFDKYYTNSDIAVCINIKRAFRLRSPLQLSDIDDNFKPPQSYRYLCNRQFQEVRNML